jgi:hypothetical protein|tara:strand:- start:442 stop:654 length:213 start_codon:yes stop_codon:yes gene_type:complete
MIREKQQKSGPIIVDLTGPDGNAFSLMALANKLAKQLGFKSPVDEMMQGDYEHLLEVFDKNFGDFVILER